MTSEGTTAGGRGGDACAAERAEVEARCRDAHEAKALHEATVERVRELKRELVAAQHHQTDTIAAADPERRAAEKAAARDAYQLARLSAKSDDEERAATADWARALDRINRAGRLSQREVSRADAAVTSIEDAMRQAEQNEQSSRMQAEQAEAGCMEARVRLAACEESAEGGEPTGPATVFEPHAATGGHAVAISETPVGPPLVIETMVSGDRIALELAAQQIAEHTGLSPAEAQIQLQELVDAIVSAASEAGYLVFDTDHHFWSGLTFEEARDVIAALARLGFVFEPTEGWHAGRAPSPSDLSMALAYAGLDARNMRDLPTADELHDLPDSISVDGRAFLAARAPNLIVDNVVRVLDRRAEQLEPLWNEWGHVRPILLSDRHQLGDVPG